MCTSGLALNPPSAHVGWASIVLCASQSHLIVKHPVGTVRHGRAEQFAQGHTASRTEVQSQVA